MPSGFVLFRVITRTDANPAIFATQKTQLTETLRAKEAERLIRAVVAQMRADRKIQINEELLEHSPGALVMHCLPAYRGKEITEEVFEAGAELIFRQAENRLHAQKAVLSLLRD